MQLSNAPQQLVLPWANSDGAKTYPIPVPSQTAIKPGAASWTDGFPVICAIPVNQGGIPPSKADMNGGLFQMSAIDVWMSAGGGFEYNSAFAASIGGYPLGARLLMLSQQGYWRSLLDNNLSDPDTGGAGWVPDSVGGSVSGVYASTQQTLATGASKVLFDSVEFDPGGLWDSTDKRFVAKWAGAYRFTSTVLLSAPAGQLFTAQTWKNGTLYRQGSVVPQVSDGNLSVSWDTVMNLSIGDYVEGYLEVPQAAVLAGVVGSNEAYVYAQFEYLG